jgi:RNA polymerase sigma-70 factor (ECF subfamily)
MSDADDAALVTALRARDEAVFSDLVSRWSGAMLRVARAHVPSRGAAEDVVQEAWLVVIRSLDRFERRSSLRTWVLGIVINVARARARAERRAVSLDADQCEPSVDPDRFLPASHPRWPHHWATEPAKWRTPEQDLLDGEARGVIAAAIENLPAAQREVLVLRDIEGLSSAEVCNVAHLTDTNQRVLLHRARSRVRTALERYLAAAEAI